ncbi:MAG: nucleotidyltransferase domain-containing protein [Nitrospirota bacterium]
MWRRCKTVREGISINAMTPRLTRFLEEVRQDEAVLAVILFGSRARGEHTPASDTDLCLVLPFGKDAAGDQVTIRMRYLKDADLDLRIFQQLPLYVRRRVLKEGVVLFCRDLDALYAMAYRTAQAFEDFKLIYRQYLEQVAHAGS